MKVPVPCKCGHPERHHNPEDGYCTYTNIFGSSVCRCTTYQADLPRALAHYTNFFQEELLSACRDAEGMPPLPATAPRPSLEDRYAPIWPTGWRAPKRSRWSRLCAWFAKFPATERSVYDCL